MAIWITSAELAPMSTGMGRALVAITIVAINDLSGNSIMKKSPMMDKKYPMLMYLA
jgi:preprotein translocase subunit SecA